MLLFNNAWPSTANATRYRLFAEQVVELVYESSWESYKCHALSTVTKIRELRVFCRKVIDRTIPKPSLLPIIQEVNDSVQSDPVCRDILSRKHLNHIELSIDFSNTVERIFDSAGLLLDIFYTEYQEACEKMILSSCASCTSSKNELITLTKLYVSCLVNKGFDKKHIFERSKETFWSGSVKRCTPGLLKRFFLNFSTKKEKKYDVSFVCKRRQAKALKNLFGFEVFENKANSSFKDIEEFPATFGEGENKRIVCIPQTSSVDPYSAVRKTRPFLNTANSLHYLHPRQSSIQIDEMVCVVEPKSQKVYKIHNGGDFQPHQHLRTRSGSSMDSLGLATYAFGATSKRDRKTQDRLYRSLNSLALASKSADHESRLVTMWSAFESLLPEPTKEEGKGARITHFVPLIVPCVCYDYIFSSFNECYFNCSKMFGPSFSEKVKEYGGSSDAKGFAAIMLAEDKAKKALLKEVSKSPLICNRLWRLHKIINDPKQLSDYWAKHEKRVDWQLHRIYRERNELVHSGAQSPFLEGLVENTYNYYRAVILGLEGVYNKYAIADPTRALELIRVMYSEKTSNIASLSRLKSRNEGAFQTKMLEINFENKLF